MKIEKVVLTLAVTALALTLAHEGLAANAKVKLLPASQTKSATAKKTPLNIANKPTKKKKLSALEREDLAIEKEIRAFELAAVNQKPMRTESLLNTTNMSTSTSQSRTKIVAVKKETSDAFSGSVNFNVGSDSNIDVDRSNQYKGTFYEIAPTVSYTSGRWNGSFGASIKDYADAVHSELFKTNEAKANITYATDFSEITKSTTAFDFLYHDERWPDYINGTVDVYGNKQSMPIRYGDFKLTQSLNFNFGNLNAQIGGSAKHRDNYNNYSDGASALFGAFQHQRDNNELTLFGRMGLQAANFLELAVRPAVKQTKFTERKARLPDGTYGGVSTPAPLFELITSEANFDLIFKFGESSITPTAVVGQTSDEGYGAEDQSFYGFGIAANLILDKTTSLTLSPNFGYKKITYDNWIADVVPTNSTRLEDEVSAGISASVKLAKNLGLQLGYSMTRETSNMEEDTSENYRQEVVTSGLNFSF